MLRHNKKFYFLYVNPYKSEKHRWYLNVLYEKLLIYGNRLSTSATVVNRQFLIEKKLRGYVSINVQSGEALDTHSFATLIGVGATTVNPYLAFDSLYQRYEKKLFEQLAKLR